MAARKKKKKTNIAATCWFLSLLVLAVIFIVKQNDIRRVLKETDFFGKVFGSTPEFIETAPEKSAPKETEKKPESAPPLVPRETTTANANNTKDDTPSEPVIVDVGTDPVPESPSPTPAAQNLDTSTVSLWFKTIDKDGTIGRREIKRALPKNESPLQSAIQSLLMGPALPEAERGCVSLIPEGTRLQSVAINNGVASLSFSADFEYNRFGVEGYLGQLEQIVYTATSFPSVTSVQFLIDGERREYIGGEGVWVGSPLRRSSFK
jgi:spore germination protein GerM